MDRLKIFDPTEPPQEGTVTYAPRPKTLLGLRLGLVENTKHNSDALLLKIAAILEQEHGVESHIIRSKKNASVPVHDELLQELAADSDAILAGIGD
jgi:hypothetical protein